MQWSGGCIGRRRGRRCGFDAAEGAPSAAVHGGEGQGEALGHQGLVCQHGRLRWPQHSLSRANRQAQGWNLGRKDAVLRLCC